MKFVAFRIPNGEIRFVTGDKSEFHAVIAALQCPAEAEILGGGLVDCDELDRPVRYYGTSGSFGPFQPENLPKK